MVSFEIKLDRYTPLARPGPCFHIVPSKPNLYTNLHTVAYYTKPTLNSDARPPAPIYEE